MPRPVLRLFCIAIVARTPYAATGLLLIVRTKELTGSYAASGLVAGAASVALALVSPWVGRLVDRNGQTDRAARGGRPECERADRLRPAAVMARRSACSSAARRSPAPPRRRSARACGRCTRRSWTASALHRVFAIESAALEVTYILGPLLMLAIASLAGTGTALVISAAALGGGTLVFSATRESRTWRAPPSDVRAAARRRAALAGPADDRDRDRAGGRDVRSDRGRGAGGLPGRRVEGRDGAAAGDLGARLDARRPARGARRRAGRRRALDRAAARGARRRRSRARPGLRAVRARAAAARGRRRDRAAARDRLQRRRPRHPGRRADRGVRLADDRDRRRDLRRIGARGRARRRRRPGRGLRRRGRRRPRSRARSPARAAARSRLPPGVAAGNP